MVSPRKQKPPPTLLRSLPPHTAKEGENSMRAEKRERERRERERERERELAS